MLLPLKQAGSPESRSRSSFSASVAKFGDLSPNGLCIETAVDQKIGLLYGLCLVSSVTFPFIGIRFRNRFRKNRVRTAVP